MLLQPARDGLLLLSADRLRGSGWGVAEPAPVGVHARIASVCRELRLERCAKLIADARLVVSVSGAITNGRGCVPLHHAKPRFVLVPVWREASTDPPYCGPIIHR